MKDITKIAKFPEKFNLMIKDASKVIENEPKEEKYGSLSMLLNTLNASLLGNLFAAHGATVTSPRRGRKAIRADKGTTRAEQNF